MKPLLVTPELQQQLDKLTFYKLSAYQLTVFVVTYYLLMLSLNFYFILLFDYTFSLPLLIALTLTPPIANVVHRRMRLLMVIYIFTLPVYPRKELISMGNPKELVDTVYFSIMKDIADW